MCPFPTSINWYIEDCAESIKNPIIKLGDPNKSRDVFIERFKYNTTTFQMLTFCLFGFSSKENSLLARQKIEEFLDSNPWKANDKFDELFNYLDNRSILEKILNVTSWIPIRLFYPKIFKMSEEPLLYLSIPNNVDVYGIRTYYDLIVSLGEGLEGFGISNSYKFSELPEELSLKLQNINK
jgi:hypothetical protein